jgi:hypothetical protein
MSFGDIFNQPNPFKKNTEEKKANLFAPNNNNNNNPFKATTPANNNNPFKATTPANNNNPFKATTPANNNSGGSSFYDDFVSRSKANRVNNLPDNPTVFTKKDSSGKLSDVSFTHNDGYTPNYMNKDVKTGALSTPQAKPMISKPTVAYTGLSTLDKYNAIKSVFENKELYNKYFNEDPNFPNTDLAKKIKSDTDKIRSDYGLSDEEFGSGVSSSDVSKALIQFQRESNTNDYLNKSDKYNQQLYKEASKPIRMRDIIGFDKARGMAKTELDPVFKQRMKDIMAKSDEDAVRRGVYGQVPIESRNEQLQYSGELAAEQAINERANQLVSEDMEKATQEYNIESANAGKKLNAFQQFVQGEKEKWAFRDKVYKEQLDNARAEAEARAKQYADNLKNQIEVFGKTGVMNEWLASQFGYEPGTYSQEMTKAIMDDEQKQADIIQRQTEAELKAATEQAKIDAEFIMQDKDLQYKYYALSKKGTGGGGGGGSGGNGGGSGAKQIISDVLNYLDFDEGTGVNKVYQTRDRLFYDKNNIMQDLSQAMTPAQAQTYYNNLVKQNERDIAVAEGKYTNPNYPKENKDDDPFNLGL